MLTEYGELLTIKATPEKFDLVSRVTLGQNSAPLLKHPAYNAPVLSNGLLYVRGKDRLVCLDLARPRS